jgi:hypothetical protein
MSATQDPHRSGEIRREYEPPSIHRLGTLAELTKGGTVGPDDGLGGAGDDGSL